MATRRAGFLPSNNFMGSSGAWATTPSLASGSPSGGYFPEYGGYPGDAWRNSNTTTRNYNFSSGASRGSSQLYEPIQITKSPGVAGAAGNLLDAFNRGSADIPGFSELLNGARGASGLMKSAFNREQQAFDLGPYAATQRGLDDRLAGLTSGYAGTARDIGDRYASSDANYAARLGDITNRAYGILPEYDNAARAIGDEQLAQLQGAVSRYKFGNGNLGLGGDELRKIARGVANVELPLAQQKIQRKYDVLTGVELPANREVATREAARLAGFEYPMESNIYSRQYDVEQTRKNTEGQLKQLELSVSGMNRAAAESYLRSMALPASIIQEVLARHNQVLSGQIANASGIGGLEDQAYYRGLEYLPGANITPSNYYSPNTPMNSGSFPSRNYTPNVSVSGAGPTATGTGAGNYKYAAGTLQGDRERGMPAWAIQQRMQQGMYGYAPTQQSTVPPNTGAPPAYQVRGGYTTNARDNTVTPLGDYREMFTSGLNYSPDQWTPGQRDYMDALSRSYE